MKEVFRSAMHSTSRLAFLGIALFSAAGSAQVRRTPDARATVNLDQLAGRPEARLRTIGASREAQRPRRFRPGLPASASAAQSVERLAARAPEAAATAVTPVYGGFRGLMDNFTAVPPDTEGAVGPRDVVTMLNTQVDVQSRTGAERANFPVSLDAFWSPLGSFNSTFDPHVLYDSSKDRWIATAVANGQSTSAAAALLVGVSQSGDPGGAWNMWSINLGVAGGNWGDYPTPGFNGNWVVVSLNLFRHTGTYIRTDLYVFDKADLYANGPGTSTVFNDDGGVFTPALDFDNHPDTLYFAQAFSADVGYHVGVGTIRLSKLTSAGGPLSFSGGNVGEITISDGWSDSGPMMLNGNVPDFAPQLGTPMKIDTGDSRLQNCVMRGGTIWCAHTIFLPAAQPTRAAVQWFQIDPQALKVVQRGRIDDAGGTSFYAYPSIAVNARNDVLVGYNRFSANEYPSAAFSFRATGDPANMLQREVIFKRGEASYVNVGARSGSNRWGDYSATMVDPADDLTFWTIQEYAAISTGRQNGMFGTWWAQVAAPSSGLNCTYSLAPANQLLPVVGGDATVSVTANSGCLWMAASNVPWVTVNAGSPGSGSGTVSYTVASPVDPASTRSGTISVAGQTFTVTEGSASQQPAVPSQGIVNAASYKGGGIAPLELVTLFGTGLGPSTLQQSSVTAGIVGTAAGGTRVLFDGVAAPMIYALGGQVTAVVPGAVQGRATTEVQVLYQGTLSNALIVPVVAAAPGIFTLDASGLGQGAIRNQDASVNGAGNSAARGSVVSIYATGGGVIPGVHEGVLATTGQLDLSAVSARIGGFAATVQYAGVAPGIVVGVMQFNVVVPAGAAPGNAVPVEITIAGATSPSGVTMAVK